MCQRLQSLSNVSKVCDSFLFGRLIPHSTKKHAHILYFIYLKRTSSTLYCTYYNKLQSPPWKTGRKWIDGWMITGTYKVGDLPQCKTEVNNANNIFSFPSVPQVGQELPFLTAGQYWQDLAWKQMIKWKKHPHFIKAYTSGQRRFYRVAKCSHLHQMPRHPNCHHCWQWIHSYKIQNFIPNVGDIVSIVCRV